jgi:hypothetical protein
MQGHGDDMRQRGGHGGMGAPAPSQVK